MMVWTVTVTVILKACEEVCDLLCEISVCCPRLCVCVV